MTKGLRSQPTRDRIRAAARKMFGEVGFERTTIRAVAAAAATNPGLVIRYYGSKEGLFAAAAKFDLRLPDLSSVPRAAVGETLVRHFLQRWGGARAGDELPSLIRIAVSHDGARTRLLDLFQTQVVPAIAALCAPERTATAAALIGSQLAGLALTRYVLCLPAVVALDAETIAKRVGAVIQAYLEG